MFGSKYIDKLPEKERLFYFDWNVFKHLQNPTSNDDKIFKKIIEAIATKYPLYYSHAHIEDLTHNYDESKREYIVKDTDFITHITGDNCIWHDVYSDRVEYIGICPPLQAFDDIIQGKNKEEIINPIDNMLNILQEYPEQLEQYQDSLDLLDTLFESLTKQHGSKFTQSMEGAKNMREYSENMMAKSKEMFASSEGYKKERNTINENKEALIKLCSQGTDKSITEPSTENIREIFNRLNIPLPSVVNADYMELDLFGEVSEKINKDNPPKNVLNDNAHFSYAKNFIFFITEDKGCYKKSKALIEKNNISTKVMSIEEFNKERAWHPYPR